jgi:hydroxyethylthiazole kinase-like sugar kinase family protein
MGGGMGRLRGIKGRWYMMYRMSSAMSLVDIKNNIECLSKNYQIEILDYLHNIPQIKLNENENGIFINIGLLKKEEIAELQKKVEAYQNMEKMLNP